MFIYDSVETQFLKKNILQKAICLNPCFCGDRTPFESQRVSWHKDPYCSSKVITLIHIIVDTFIGFVTVQPETADSETACETLKNQVISQLGARVEQYYNKTLRKKAIQTNFSQNS